MVKDWFLRYFEDFMRISRYFILVAIFSSVLSSVFLFIWSLKHVTFGLFGGEVSEKEIIVTIITSIDFFLIGIIALIFAWSLYELFIRDPNKECPDTKRIPYSLVVYSFDELKDKLSKIIIILLIITFFRYAFYLEYDTIYELMAFAFSILMISLSLFFTKSNGEKSIKNDVKRG